MRVESTYSYKIGTYFVIMPVIILHTVYYRNLISYSMDENGVRYVI